MKRRFFVVIIWTRDASKIVKVEGQPREGFASFEESEKWLVDFCDDDLVGGVYTILPFYFKK